MRTTDRTAPAGRRRRLLGIVVVWFALLTLSALVRSRRHSEPASGPGDAIVTLQEVKGGRHTGRPVTVAYSDLHPPAPSDQSAPIVLLHGSPGTRRDFGRMGPDLARTHRVIFPDLPGFGASSHDVADYSFRAHADYVLQLLDRLGIRRAHIGGFSMGGGVALNLIDLAPERVESLMMLSGLGVQEMELLGDYRLNHAVHGLQLGFLWMLREGTPHMGLLDEGMLDVPYARNFYDSDQRPLRGILTRVQVPTLIVHGTGDVLVPFAAAVEHHRLVPQSELRTMSGDNHFMVFMKPSMMAGLVRDFVERVEAGVATGRDRAAPERIRAAAAPFDVADIPRATGITALVFAGLLAAATLVSEDLTCIAAGVMVAQGRIGFLAATSGCFFGILIGDMLLFFAGRYIGRPIVEAAPLKWFVTPQALQESSRWLKRRGAVVALLTRFLPGTRLPTYLAAGLLDTSVWGFSGYFILAGLLWTPLLVGLSMIVGGGVLEATLARGRSAWLPAIAAIAIVAVLVRVLVRASTWRGRRMLVSSWRRKTRWEFWPPWIFYPPVIAYLGYLMVKHRSPTLFTAANPGILAGGFVGESKIDILRNLAGAGSRVATAQLIEGLLPPAAKIQAADAFLRSHGLSLPVVLKPNHGQRGSGVVVVRSDEALREYLRQTSVDTIIQEYVPGLEFGIFYYRRPSEAAGRIFSVTEKQFPEVIGDGTRTLEALILDDPRAVCMAGFYLNRHRNRLEEIPASGTHVPLVDLGTHCRGAKFMDGAWVVTPALDSAFDAISKTFDGFFFGRFDVRTSSAGAFREARHFKIVELNGVTSEATHIYDPRNSLWAAYRVLFTQWRVAFEIGAENRARGVRSTSLRVLWRLVRDYRVSSRFHLAERPEQGITAPSASTVPRTEATTD